ncbi:complex I 24 kDa subunit family protein [Ethanoligenens sp.]|uniref:complex I 24 kDa subunit family protein n=1 Tax=Ethanoligenens sp. TaxID=2099655 RepID=UPI0039E7AC10
MTIEQTVTTVDAIVDRHNASPSALIAILEEIQEACHYLPGDALTRVSERTGISEGEIFSVATFYKNFSLTAKGRYVIKVCDGTACHVRKSIPILNALREHLGVSAEKPTTEDNLFTVETVSCLGACGLAPVMTVNDHVHPKMTPESALEVVSGLRGEAKE